MGQIRQDGTIVAGGRREALSAQVSPMLAVPLASSHTGAPAAVGVLPHPNGRDPMTDLLFTRAAVSPTVASRVEDSVADTPRLCLPCPLLKRLLDLVVASMLLLVLLPVLLVVLIAVRLESRGPVFFKQQRVGRDHRLFWMYKVRSMRADAGHAAVSADDPHNFSVKLAGDPRVTRVGRIIRKRSIDEIPQLWNVIRGDMSLVGPRPALPHEVALYDCRALQRLRVLPGLTGPWQVGGRCNVTFDEMLDMDLDYAARWSPLNDLVILVKTPFAALAGRGAA